MNKKIFLAVIFILTLSFTSASGVCRDVNQDGVVNKTDVNALINYAFNGYDIPAGVNADLNNDGFVDVLDVISLINCVYRNESMMNSECGYSCFVPNNLGDHIPATIFDSGEKTLQSILNDSGYSINVSDQTNIQVWEVVQDVKLEVTYIGGISSYPHAFGYYEKGDINSFVPLFQDIEYLKYSVPVAKPGDKFSINLKAGDEIGFAIDSHGSFNDSGIVATEDNLNNPQRDQALVFKEGNEFVFGFEDTYRDWDYQDVIVSVKVINCEPSAQPVCGDGHLDAGEQCDEGEGNTLNGCNGNVSSYCEYQTCKIIQCQPINITCSSNSNCGTDFDTGNSCSANNVVKNHTSFTCHNPNTTQSYCSSSTNQVLVQACSNICMNGVCQEQNATCGNGIVEAGEQCDTGISNGIICDNYYNSCTYCSSSCKTVQRLQRNHNNDNNNNNNEFQIASFMKSVCNPSWECTGWNDCMAGISTRSCVDVNHCGVQYNKPFEQTACQELNNVLTEKQTTSGFPLWLLIVLAIFILLIIILIVNWR